MEAHKKTTCETKGHSWTSTTSIYASRCSRCTLTRTFINGQWIEYQPAHVKVMAPQAEQSSLWA